MKAPAFQWYPKDCDTDENVRAMDDREFGFYMRCLNHAWLNDGLPGDLVEVGRVLNRPTTYVKKLWTRVGRCFHLTPDGRYRNVRQEEQRVDLKEFRESRRKAAEVRWHKQVESECNARASEMQCSPSASPSAYTHTDARGFFDPTEGDAPSTSEAFDLQPISSVSKKTVSNDLLQRFEEFWSVVWAKIGKGAARDAWRSKVKTQADADRVIAAAKQQGPAILDRAKRGNITPVHPSTWLNQERYDDDVNYRPATPPQSVMKKWVPPPEVFEEDEVIHHA